MAGLVGVAVGRPGGRLVGGGGPVRVGVVVGGKDVGGGVGTTEGGRTVDAGAEEVAVRGGRVVVAAVVAGAVGLVVLIAGASAVSSVIVAMGSGASGASVVAITAGGGGLARSALAFELAGRSQIR